MIIERINKEINMNKCITVEEAERILEIVKRVYPGVFDGLKIEYGDYYCYNNRAHRIWLEKDMSIADEMQCQYIIEHINKTYGLNLGYDKRTISMQAFLHELGHCADLAYRKAQGRYKMYIEQEEDERMIFDTKKYAYYRMCQEREELIEEMHFNPDLSDEERNELMYEAEEIREEMNKVEAELDKEYRMIITEKAADKFSADLLKGLFRNII